jgi:hypothetical protein
MIVYLFLSLVWAASRDPVREQHEEYQCFKRTECVKNFVSLLLEKTLAYFICDESRLTKEIFEIKKKTQTGIYSGNFGNHLLHIVL